LNIKNAAATKKTEIINIAKKVVQNRLWAFYFFRKEKKTNLKIEIGFKVICYLKNL